MSKSRLEILMLLRELLSPDVARRDCDGKWVIDYDSLLATVQQEIASTVALNARRDDSVEANAS